MKKNLLSLAIGIISTAALIKYLTIPANSLLVAGAVILVISLIMMMLNNQNSQNNHNLQSEQHTTQSTTTEQANHYSTNPVIEDSVNGTVKWFNKTKGFGFITQENGEDVFVHQTSIAFRPNVLREGQEVTLSIVMDKKGPQAENVRKRA